MNLTPKERELIFIMSMLAIVAVFYAISIKDEIARGVVIEQQVAEYQKSIEPFMDLALNAKSFAIYDMDNKNFVYKRDAERQMPLASLTKVMSAMVILESVPADHVFTISEKSLSEVGDNKLLLDEKWGRDELLKFALVESSNDALWQMAYETGKIIDPASADPVAVFVARMNEKAMEMKLTGFEFKNPSGLDVGDGTNGGYGNARNMAKLFTEAVSKYPDIFAPTRESAPIFHSLDSEHIAKNTNPFTSEIPGLMASKTGFTNISGGNLVVAVKDDKDRNLALVVMGSTFDDRFTDVKTISGTLRSPQEAPF